MTNIWDTDFGAMAGANSFATLNTLYLLIDKKLISQQKAAQVFTETARQVREGTEDGAHPEIGERVATMMETMAGWCLGHSGVL
ncbi:hypothetical protein ACMFL9_26530 [Sinorhizobium meliloti]